MLCDGKDKLPSTISHEVRREELIKEGAREFMKKKKNLLQLIILSRPKNVKI
jgi:hypothetical protein